MTNHIFQNSLMVCSWLLGPALRSNLGSRLLLLVIELLELLVDLFGIEICGVYLWHWPLYPAWENDALHHLLFVLLGRLLLVTLRRCRYNCEWLCLLRELFGLHLIQEITILSLHTVHALCIHSDRMGTQSWALFSFHARHY